MPDSGNIVPLPKHFSQSEENSPGISVLEICVVRLVNKSNSHCIVHQIIPFDCALFCFYLNYILTAVYYVSKILIKQKGDYRLDGSTKI